MKKKLLNVILGAVLASTSVSSFAQGYFLFDNSSMYTGDNTSPVLSFIALNNFGPPQGTAGMIVGSGGAGPYYSVSFLWAPGLPSSFASFEAFLNVAAQGGAEAQQYDYIAPSGDVANGAGIFTGGNATLNGTGAATGVHVTVAVISWYNPGGNTYTWQQARMTGGINTGVSELMDIRLAVGADPVIADMSGMQGFPIPQIPEPSSLTLAGLGAVLMLFRRRK